MNVKLPMGPSGSKFCNCAPKDLGNPICHAPHPALYPAPAVTTTSSVGAGGHVDGGSPGASTAAWGGGGGRERERERERERGGGEITR